MILNKDYNLEKNSWSGNDPRSILLHSTGGNSLIGAIETLKLRGLSYNYIIFRGEIYEIVHWSRCAWHAGVIKRAVLRAKVFFKTLVGPDNPNRNSVGIAFVETNHWLSDEDVDAFVVLSKTLGQETNYRYTSDNIFGHYEVTYDKPWYVKNFKAQCVDALIGDKDDKDAGEMSRKKLLIKYLTLQVKLLTLQLFTRRQLS